MFDDRVSGPRAATPIEAPHSLDAVDACPDCRISRTEFLDRLPRGVRVELQSRRTTRDIPAGEILCAAGDAARALYILRAGRMKIRSGGRVVKVCRPGEILGGGAVAAGVPHLVDFIALDACTVDTIAALARLRLHVASAIVACAGAAHGRSGPQAIVLSAETIARLARVLADLGCFRGEATDDGVRVALTLSHQSIAQLLALPEAAVADIFEKLESRGILYADGAGITILSSISTGTPPSFKPEERIVGDRTHGIANHSL